MDDEKYLQILKLFLIVKNEYLSNSVYFEQFISHIKNLPKNYFEYTDIEKIINLANDFISSILGRRDLINITLQVIESKNFAREKLDIINQTIPDQIIIKKSIDDILKLGGKRSRNIRRSKRSRNIRRSKKY